MQKKAKNELGWVAERGIDKMCEDSWRWQTMNRMDMKLNKRKKNVSGCTFPGTFFSSLISGKVL